MTLIEKAIAKQEADSQPQRNATAAPQVPVTDQGLREYEECIRALRERLQAAGGQ